LIVGKDATAARQAQAARMAQQGLGGGPVSGEVVAVVGCRECAAMRNAYNTRRSNEWGGL